MADSHAPEGHTTLPANDDGKKNQDSDVILRLRDIDEVFVSMASGREERGDASGDEEPKEIKEDEQQDQGSNVKRLRKKRMGVPEDDDRYMYSPRTRLTKHIEWVKTIKDTKEKRKFLEDKGYSPHSIERIFINLKKEDLKPVDKSLSKHKKSKSHTKSSPKLFADKLNLFKRKERENMKK